jgi:glutamine phosphoribosylpyrophosphate amidotransferase
MAMLKQDLIAALRKASGGAEFISQKELMTVLGFKDPHRIRELVTGVSRIGKRYYLPEVAGRIMQEVER